jgi:FMN phosphatase YigB (HAD superfamily)
VAKNETWAFDVDGTVVDSLTGTSLRPGTVELLSALRGDGRRIVWWSAGGADHARARAEALGVVDLVDAFHDKGGRDGDGRFAAEQLAGGPDGVVFVDDRPEDVPLGSRVLAVSPYLAENPHDRGLARALEAIAALVR